jgi:hypothetical protein
MRSYDDTRARDTAAIKALLVDIPHVCSGLGIRYKSRPEGKHRGADYYKVFCPWHQEKTPSCSLSIGESRTLRAYCFSCHGSSEKGKDVFDLIAVMRGLDINRDFLEIRRIAADLANYRLDEPQAVKSSYVPPKIIQPLAEASVEPSYPPVDEVRALWAACIPASDDAQATAWLRSRRLDPTLIDDFVLAKVIPSQGLSLPEWARHWMFFNARLLVPLFDAAGAMRSFKGRNLSSRPDPGEKSIAAKGASKKLVMADGVGQALLAGRNQSTGLTTEVILTEGEPDFLLWATRYPDSYETPPAVLGVYSGSWTEAIAERIPDNSEVVSRLDPDPGGEKLEAPIRDTLKHRCRFHARERGHSQ